MLKRRVWILKKWMSINKDSYEFTEFNNVNGDSNLDMLEYLLNILNGTIQIYNY